MPKFYVILEMEDCADLDEADSFAEGISDTVQQPIAGLFTQAEYDFTFACLDARSRYVG